MCRRGWLVLLLVLGFTGLRAMAEASPPDPLWLPGVYDDADHDDVVLAVLSLDGFRDDAPATLGPPARLVVVMDSLRLIAPRPVPRSFQESRAPPAF
jgi:hypothetical protein